MSATIAPDYLRDKHRTQRRLINAEDQAEHADALCKRLLSLQPVQTAHHIAAYIAVQGEISLAPVMQHLVETGKQLYLPVLRGRAMHFAPWHFGEPLLKKGFGLLEPNTPESNWLPAEQLDLVLAPLVVFDSACNRVGQGGGYYDRTFAFRPVASHIKPLLLGVAHDSQREPTFAVEHWDVPLDIIATEKTLYTRP